MTSESDIPLGRLLVEKKLITQQQLDTALKKQKETGELLGVVLLELGFVRDENAFLPLLAEQLKVKYVNLKNTAIPPEAVAKIPPKFASHYKIMPIKFQDDVLTIATTKPLDIQSQDEISLVVNTKLETVLASRKDILESIRQYYGVGAETIDQMMSEVRRGQIKTVALTKSPGEEVTDITEIESEASISKFINQILLAAYRDRATDIHIEPFEDDLKIRYRIDGVLCDAKVPGNIKHFKDSINSRIKILSNLNIAEKRAPQDGRFKVRLDDVDLDLRVSFLPTPYGESAVLRILNAARLYSFEELGLSSREQETLNQLIQKPHGIIFLTGPTGSGKTTTLYACLSKINTEDKKIITIEDPIEYQLKGITQIQINPKVGLTFAQGLRSMLRHDPDIMMVGEVRDIETADIAIRVALTGHLIFSTLHTNDAVSGIARLVDMGVEPYLITTTVECFIAQRLVRILCPECKQASPVTADSIKEFADFRNADPDMTIYESKGCDACNFTGYRGRQAIYEFLPLNDAIRQMMIDGVSMNQIKERAVAAGMTTLRQAGWEKIKKGLTNPAEVIRVTEDEGGV